MGVRPTTHRTHPPLCQSRCQRLRVKHNLLSVPLIFGRTCFFECHSFCGDRVHQRAALHHWENGLVNCCRMLLLAQNHSATRSTQNFVGGKAHHICIRHRAGNGLPRNQTNKVRGINHKDGTHFISNFTESSEVNESGIRGRTTNNHFGLMLNSQPTHFRHIN